MNTKPVKPLFLITMFDFVIGSTTDFRMYRYFKYLLMNVNKRTKKNLKLSLFFDLINEDEEKNATLINTTKQLGVIGKIIKYGEFIYHLDAKRARDVFMDSYITHIAEEQLRKEKEEKER